MASSLRLLVVTALLTTSATLTAAQSGSGTTTRYWDCCKPTCAWTGKGVDKPVQVCDKSDKPLTGGDSAPSGCNGGTAYMCSSQSPWKVSDDLAYGFASVTAANPNCCECYQLTFTSGPISGKKMVVQATNTGTDVGSTQFDIAIPGGGFGLFDGCATEWGATSDVWGAQYGGQATTNTCPQFPAALKPGCEFRWDWMQGGSNPSVDWEIVTCPADLVAKSGCSVNGYSGGSTGSLPSPTASSLVSSAAGGSGPSSSSAALQSGSPAGNGTSTSSGSTGSQSSGTTGTGSTGTGEKAVEVGYDECEAGEL